MYYGTVLMYYGNMSQAARLRTQASLSIAIWQGVTVFQKYFRSLCEVNGMCTLFSGCVVGYPRFVDGWVQLEGNGLVFTIVKLQRHPYLTHIIYFNQQHKQYNTCVI